MDIDRFLAVNGPTWARLGELTDHAGRGVGRLSAAELDELVRLYQRVSTHLSVARTYYRDPALTAHLSRLVARSGSVIYGTRARTIRAGTRIAPDMRGRRARSGRSSATRATSGVTSSVASAGTSPCSTQPSRPSVMRAVCAGKRHPTG